MDQAGQESTRSQHHALCIKAQTDLGHNTNHPITLHHQIVYGLLEYQQIDLLLDAATDGAAIQHAIRLGPGGPHRRAFA